MGTPTATWWAAPLTIISAADLSGKEGYGYKLDSAGKAVLATAAAVDGVIVDGGTASGDPLSAAPAGCGLLVKVLCGGTANERDALTTDSNGKFIATTTTGDDVVGYAYTNGASGSDCRALLMGGDRRYN